MTNERLHEIINGPLSHPLPVLTISRLALALAYVVGATGEEGDRALEEAAYRRARQDGDEEWQRHEPGR